MPANPNKLSQFWQELKRRRVTRVITVYAAAAFAILELVSIIVEPLNLPVWTLPLIIVLLCIGFVIAIILSWIYDITPEGIEKTGPAGPKSEITAKDSSGLKSWKYASYFSFAVILALILLNIFPRNKTDIPEIVPGKSIAVLPFEDMSSEQDQEYFCDGMAEEIINSLAQLDSLKVIARTSTFAFKDKPKDIREIGKLLEVSTVLEGSVQKVGSRLRITAQLINVEDGTHIWSEQYDREMEDVFIIQDEISEAIVDKLRIELLGKQGKSISKRQTENLEAYNLYLKGRFFWHRRTEEDLLKSMELYQQALKLDSTYALAYAGLADVYFIMTWWGFFPREEGFETGKSFASKALLINDKLSEAHATQGGLLTWYDWDWKGAEQELKLAISLNPNYANAYQYYSELMSILGKSEEARTYIDKALELNPNSQIMYNLSSRYYYDDGAYEKAIEECRKALEIAEFGWPLQRLFFTYFILGNDQEALRYLKEIVSMATSKEYAEILDSIFLESGMEGILHWYIDWLQDNISQDFYYKVNLNLSVAGIYGLLGDAQQAMEFLEKAWEAGESSLPNIKYNPNLALLWDDPRFKAMLIEMNLD
jgi:TolB-like protein